MEAFSDAVFAIAITLLALELRLPPAEALTSNLALLRALTSLWPSYLALLLSFALILMIWVNHHELFRMIRGVNHTLMFANGALLLMVTLAPFSTMVLAQHLGRPTANAAVAFYLGIFF